MTTVINNDHARAGHDLSTQDKNFELIDLNFSLNRLGGDNALLYEIVQIFFEDSPKLLQELVNAFKDPDSTSVRQAAHALKGLVSNFGENEAVELIRKVELAAKEDDMNSARHDFAAFRDKYATLHRELAELVG